MIKASGVLVRGSRRNGGEGVKRLVRGLGSVLALFLGLAGLPAALLRLGGSLPTRWDWASVREALFTPDDGTVLLGLLTVVG